MLITDLSALLEGKFGLLAQFYQREAVFACFLHIASTISALGSTDAQRLAEIVCPVLVKAINKEANESTRYVALSCLSKWLELMQISSLPADVIAMFKTGLQNKTENVVVAHVRAILLISHKCSEAISKASATLLTDLIKLVQESNKKPNVLHLAGVIALSVLSILGSKHPGILEMMKAAKISTLLLDSSSFFATSVSLLCQLNIPNSLNETAEITALKCVSAALCKNIGILEVENIIVFPYD
jgi:hypothetical protein